MTLRQRAPASAPSPASVLGSRAAHECCIWVVSPAGYPHAHAFDEVATSLAEGLASVLGSPPGAVPVVRDPADIGTRAAVVLGASLLSADTAHLLPASSVIVNLEQLDVASRWFGEHYRSLLSRHAVVDYSARNTAALHRLGLRHVRHLALGHSPGLITVPSHRTGHVDVCFYGSENARRAALLDELERRGLIVERLFGVYGPARDAAIARAKLVLNVHYYGAAVFETVRVAHLLANRVCVVTEGDTGDPDLAALAAGLAVGRYDELADRCEELAADAHARDELAAAGAAAITARPQAEAWRQALVDDADGSLPATAPTNRSVGPWHTTSPSIRRVTLLASGTADRCHALSTAAGELRGLGVDVGAVVIDHPDQVTRTGWSCRVESGRSLGQLPAVERFTHRDDHLVLAVDCLGAAVTRLAPLRRALWWFSVDDLVGPGGPLADPALVRALAEDHQIDHYHHGAYVREFLRSQGLTSRRLDDHVGPIEHLDPGLTTVVGPAGRDADRLAEALTCVHAEVLAPEPAQALDQLRSCGAYVHAGPLAGRDRTLRLAVAAGAVVFVPGVGAGRYVEDVPVPDDRRYDDAGVASGELGDRIAMAIAAPHASRWASEPYRWALEDERGAMVRQLARLVGAPLPTGGPDDPAGRV